MIQHRKIQPRRVHAGATGNDDMADAFPLRLGKPEVVQSAAEQLGRKPFKKTHALRCARKVTTAVEGIGIHLLFNNAARRIQHGIPVSDFRAVCHAQKQGARPVFPQHRTRETNEGLVQVVRRNSCRDTLEKGVHYFYSE